MTDKPKRIQRKRTRGWKMPPNTIYVGRRSVWGNPFRVSNGDCDHPECGPASHPPLTAQMAVDSFRMNLPGIIRVLSRQKRFNGDPLAMLRGKNLACWCPLDQPCHADVLLEIANS